jgi:hypothetical protein
MIFDDFDVIEALWQTRLQIELVMQNRNFKLLCRSHSTVPSRERLGFRNLAVQFKFFVQTTLQAL